MKKRYIALIVLAALIVIVIVALKIGPSIAKNYVVAHSEEIIGRKMKIENVDFSPFTFTVTVDDFAIYEPDGTTPFVAFEKFRINVNPT
ncbi:MAG: AsmA family protein, partial [Fibrobacter sp.]|nr:AsmA family protein [Fibrobacter sp.]